MFYCPPCSQCWGRKVSSKRSLLTLTLAQTTSYHMQPLSGIEPMLGSLLTHVNGFPSPAGVQTGYIQFECADTVRFPPMLTAVNSGLVSPCA